MLHKALEGAVMLYTFSKTMVDVFALILQSGVQERLDAASNTSDEANENPVLATTMKKRPLVYVYDLPAEFSSQLLQGRHFKFQCVNRLYTPLNVTLWTENLYGAKIALYETLLASEHRTTNGDEADFFYVPLLHACIVEQADAAPHLSMQGFGRHFFWASP